MKAVGLYRYLPIDDAESFLDLELDTPSASGRDLLVEVKAISVNPVDTKRRAPKDLVEKTPRVLGWDVAGVVKSVGAEASLFKPGDAVYYAGSIVRPGGNSEFHLVDERIVGKYERTNFEFSTPIHWSTGRWTCGSRPSRSCSLLHPLPPASTRAPAR